jgi:tetratricopeptide (TPR) repeat protein
MRLVLSALVAALAAFAAARWTRSTDGSEAPESTSAAELARLAQELNGLRTANQELTNEIVRREQRLAPTARDAQPIGDAEIAAALERWRAAHPTSAADAPARAPRQILTASGRDLATIPILELVQALSSAQFTHEERQELFQKVRDAGRMDEYVAAIEKLAAEDPENAELQIALGHAYLQKLFEVGNTPEAGPLAMKSDAAFDRALEIDDHNWGARFSKAVSLSNWPAFLGRGPEAIENFEILLEQQAALPKRDEFAMTYLFLGNMEQAAGDREGAIRTWRAGLEQYPDSQRIRQALELAERQGEGDAGREANR